MNKSKYLIQPHPDTRPYRTFCVNSIQLLTMKPFLEVRDMCLPYFDNDEVDEVGLTQMIEDIIFNMTSMEQRAVRLFEIHYRTLAFKTPFDALYDYRQRTGRTP